MNDTQSPQTDPKTTGESERYHVPALLRSLEVIEYLARCGQKGANLTEITAELGYPKNSLFRITTTLLDRGYISRGADMQRFRLTKKLLSCGLSAVADENIVQQSIDVMRELRDTVNASAFLGTLNATGGLILEQVPGGYPFKLSVDPGTEFCMHASAPGKAILAFMPEDEREQWIESIKFEKYNDRTITDPDAYREELIRVRACGYALDRAENFDGVHCIGAPLFDYSNRPVAVLWVSGASVSLPETKFEEYGTQVIQHALKISKRLGYFEA